MVRPQSYDDYMFQVKQKAPRHVKHYHSKNGKETKIKIIAMKSKQLSVKRTYNSNLQTRATRAGMSKLEH